jgi:hypothetical protein
MDTLKVMSALLADSGEYCIFAFRTADDRKAQKFYPSVEVAIEAAHQFDQNGYDAYFALATFVNGESRKVDNIKYLKSLFLDLDCGEGKEYTDQESALIALQSFCKKLKLPRPLLINSGRGIHVYWPLTKI